VRADSNNPYPPVEDCEIIEIGKYEGADIVYKESTAPNSSILSWGNAATPRNDKGQEAQAYAKILVVEADFYFRQLSFFGTISEAFHISPRMFEDLRRYVYGVYCMEYQSNGSSSAFICGYSQFDTSFLRAVWSFSLEHRLTQAIVVGRPWNRDAVKYCIRHLSHFVGHPLFLCLVGRETMLDNSNQYIMADNAALDKVERSIGYSAFLQRYGEQPVNQENTPDLAEKSKMVGKSISSWSHQKSRIKVQTPIQKHLVKGASFRWTHLFPALEQKAYEEECKRILAKDEFLQIRYEAYLAKLDFEVERAKTLITVVGF
jgi:hypothetical protein